MKKKIVGLFVATLLVCLMLPTVALADTPVDVSIAPNLTVSNVDVTFIGTSSNTKLQLTNATFTLDNVNINNTDFGLCAIKFTGTNNTLVLKGTNVIKSGPTMPGIMVEQGTELTIEGDGTLIVTGGDDGAGIGTGLGGANCGDITITSGTVIATGGRRAAGVGTCTASSIGTVTVSGGTLYAKGDISEARSDIGGLSTSGMLNISNDGAIFSQYNMCTLSTINTTHINSTYSNSSQLPAGYSVPSNWVYPVSAYLPNYAPSFTSDEQNTTQTICSGENIAPLKAQDPNGASDIVGYSLVGGSLPDWVSLQNDGTFSGVPSTGSYSMTIEVRDTAGLTDTTTLNLEVVDTLVDITNETTTLGFGETFTVSATTTPSGKPVQYYSNNTTIATVDENTGLVTAQSKEGRVLIEAISGEGNDICTVYVVDRSEPLPSPSDPTEDVTVQIIGETGNPYAGLHVSLFSDPQTAITDGNGMAIFKNVPYNTNDPHLLIIQDFRGLEMGRYNLNFISGSAPSSSVSGNDIDLTFDNTVNNTILSLTTREGSVESVVANFDTRPAVQKAPDVVENPVTGYFSP